MLWNASLIGTLINSVLVCFGAAGLAVAIGLCMALLTTCFRVPLRHLLSMCMLSLILVPVYVQATAWSAGFGVQGWFRLSQVAAAISPSRAIASVVWIHGTASAPFCFLLCVLGLSRAMDFNTRQALLDFGPWYAATRVVVPRAWPWIAASGLWTVAMTGNDMVVTNLFQVPTVTESVYQQVQFNQLRLWSIVLACSFACLVGGLTVCGYLQFEHRLGSEEGKNQQPSNFQAFAFRGFARGLGSLLALVLVAIVVLLPVANLIVQAGWLVRMEDGVASRKWSLWTMIESVSLVKSFASEFAWSIQLSAFSTCLALILAYPLVLACRGRWKNAMMVGGMGFLLALPGPIVNLLVIQLLNRSESNWGQFVADRSLIGPILAMQCRCLPVAFGIVWIAKKRFDHRNRTNLQMDQGLPRMVRIWISAKAMAAPVLVASVVSFFVAFADLSSYLLVQPPGVTTIAMRMFDLLHYGTKNQESGLALVLVAFGMVSLFLLSRQMDFES